MDREPRVRFRAEGHSLLGSVPHAVSYLLKYLCKEWDAPADVRAWFESQKELQRLLADRATDAAPEARLAFVGDIMWIRDNWSSFLDERVRACLNAADIVLGNLETVVSKHARLTPAWLPDAARFNSDPRLVDSFVRPDGRSTFSALGTINNHALDRGDDGAADTCAFLDERGIAQSGVHRTADEKPWVTFTRNGIKVGFYAAAWGLNSPKLERTTALRLNILPGIKATDVGVEPDMTGVRKALQGMADDGAEFRVVSLHGGHEYEMYPTRKIMALGRRIVAAGADLIIGSHPHVPQPVEVCFVGGYEARYGSDHPLLQPGSPCVLGDDASGPPRKALIACSLGNFTTAMGTIPCRLGLILSLNLHRDSQTGRVDWAGPEARWCLNMPQPATRRRALMLVEDYLSEAAPGRRLDRTAAAIARVREHVGF